LLATIAVTPWRALTVLGLGEKIVSLNKHCCVIVHIQKYVIAYPNGICLLSVPEQTHPENTNATASTSGNKSVLQTIFYSLILLSERKMTHIGKCCKLPIRPSITPLVHVISFCKLTKVAGSTKKPANKIHTKIFVNMPCIIYEMQI
jgi:hypothetical protein